jgi:hypothetical protein
MSQDLLLPENVGLMMQMISRVQCQCHKIFCPPVSVGLMMQMTTSKVPMSRFFAHL